jgi:hypothetical protein
MRSLSNRETKVTSRLGLKVPESAKTLGMHEARIKKQLEPAADDAGGVQQDRRARAREASPADCAMLFHVVENTMEAGLSQAQLDVRHVPAAVCVRASRGFQDPADQDQRHSLRYASRMF